MRSKRNANERHSSIGECIRGDKPNKIFAIAA